MGDNVSVISSDQWRQLHDEAVRVLDQNRLTGWTMAAPRLYPHQWSWDSAFIAIGLVHIDPDRAMEELRSLFRAQWRNGMIPHIVFNPEIADEEYFPSAGRWNCAEVAPDSPAGVRTSGIAQPPVHAIAAQRAVQASGPERRTQVAREAFGPLFEWHRYLLSVRDPEGSGLVTIVHPWESFDNSPRWDAALEAIDVDPDRLAPYERSDLTVVADTSQRPSKDEYDRYLWLMDRLIDVGYRVDEGYSSLPFRIKDVFFSAILVAANEALLRIAPLADATIEQLEIIESWVDRGRRGLARQWNDERTMCCDFDLVAERDVCIRTIASYAPLIAGGVNVERREALLSSWNSTDMLGHPDLRWKLPPSTSPSEPAFDARAYWRGPVWPVMNWLFWWALERSGAQEDADWLKAEGMRQIQEIGFAEYVEPFTGEPLGSMDQSWTAAVMLDWLADDDG
jgi:glycogen debranching enzyme